MTVPVLLNLKISYLSLYTFSCFFRSGTEVECVDMARDFQGVKDAVANKNKKGA